MNKKICSVVMNSVSRDARVLKQARSLAKAGYDLTLIGISDSHFSSSRESIAENLEIRRVNLKLLRICALAMINVAAIIFLISLLFFLRLLFPSFDFLMSMIVFVGLMGFAAFQLAVFTRSVKGVYEDTESSKAGNNSRRFIHSILNKLTTPILRYLWHFFRLIPFVFLVMRTKPDVLHCHDIYTLRIGFFAKLFLRCPIVYDAHEIYEEVPQILAGDGSRLRSFQRTHKLAQYFIDHFIAINESAANWYSEKYPKFPKACIIMNATILSKGVNYDGRLHQAAGLTPKTNILLYQGGFSTHRGLDFLVRSAEFLPDDWVLVMMGWGNYEEYLRQLAGEINSRAALDGRSDVIKFIPPAPQSELTEWSAGGTIGVIPYENTGLNHWFCTPNKMWEFPNAGLAVLVSPFPELRRPIDLYQNGWLLPKEEDVYFIGKLIRSLSSNDIATARQNSRTFIENDNWALYERRLVDLYRQLLPLTN